MLGDMRFRRLGVLTLAAALLPAASAAAEPIELAHIPKCTELVPAAVSVPTGGGIDLQVRVLLDGVGSARGNQVFETVKRSYAPLGIAVQPSFQSVSFSGDDSQSLINQAKATFGGQRPAGTDVVYVLTSKNITAGSLGDGVAGMADCIGGVAFGDRAFAVGENFNPDNIPLGPIDFVGNLTAKVAAHEVGHLFGGHHHYAECVTGLASEVGEEVSPCTLMINDVGLASLNFSLPNGLVVLGHAEAYAD
jgi:hypothetical protein